ncbi:MAG TPA: FixH family protein [Usitatibacter sp.]|nr:FixH family protein [Usitatibacter sp.]
MSTEAVSKPWHREPWPWILMAGPAIVVVAGIVTTVLAVTSSDGVVADDYYKQGLGINRVIERDARARSLGIAAQVTFNEERDGVRVMLASNAPLPASLRLKIIAARRDADQTIELRHAGPSLYEGRLTPPRGSHLRLALEDGAATWRVTGDYKSPSPLGEGLSSITLGSVD